MGRTTPPKSSKAPPAVALARLRLKVPADVNLRSIVFSHGWFHLPPFAWELTTEALAASGWIGGTPVDLTLRQPSPGHLSITARRSTSWTTVDRHQLRSMVGSMLGLSLDLSEFHELAGDRFEWARRRGVGRMLRSTSVFEDAVKMLATTNCSWSLTRQMVTRLVEELGEPTAAGRRAFPTPQAMARRPATFFRDVIRAGYRADYLARFADDVARGRIDPESWATFPGPTRDLVHEMRRVRGLGPYAAENLCKLLGRFDGLGLDSWCVKKFPQIHGPVKGDVSQAIRRHYEPFGRWRGLALWLDLTRDWHERGAHADATTSFAKP